MLSHAQNLSRNKEARKDHLSSPASTGKRTSVGSASVKRKSGSWFSDEDTSAQYTPAIRTERFLNARIQELRAIADNVPLQSSGKNSGRSLRRRAGSFRSYRLPFVIRARPCKKVRIALDLSCSKQPCRAKRRFRRILALRQGKQLDVHDVNQTQKPLWLETHLWHCKRMYMMERWGFYLADGRCDTGARAACRWARTYCTIHDASYTTCIQLQGPQSKLLNALHSVLGSKTMPLPTALQAKVVAGGIEVEGVLHWPGVYPLGALSPVRIIWRPVSLLTNDGSIGTVNRTVWVWVHPAASANAREILVSASAAADDEKAAGAPQILVHDLCGELLRMELRGPTADAVLRAVFCPTPGDGDGRGVVSAFWRDPGSITPEMRLLSGQAVMVRCHDPRLLFPLPHHRALAARSCAGPARQAGASPAISEKPWLCSSAPAPQAVPAVLQHAAAAADGPLWHADGRRELHGARAEAVAAVNARRSRGLLHPVRPRPQAAALVGGSGHLETLCVLLVRVCGPAGENGGPASCGWDVVLPAGWGATIFQQVGFSRISSAAWPASETSLISLCGAVGPVRRPRHRTVRAPSLLARGGHRDGPGRLLPGGLS